MPILMPARTGSNIHSGTHNGSPRLEKAGLVLQRRPNPFFFFFSRTSPLRPDNMDTSTPLLGLLRGGGTGSPAPQNNALAYVRLKTGDGITLANGFPFGKSPTQYWAPTPDTRAVTASAAPTSSRQETRILFRVLSTSW